MNSEDSEGYNSDQSEANSEWSQNESGDYPDEMVTNRSISEELENITETLKSLTDAKYSLIISIANKKIDPVLFIIKLNEINKQINEVGNAKTPLETELATKEFEYSYRLNQFSEIVKSRSLSISERKELERLNKELVEVRSIYSKHFQPQETIANEIEFVGDEIDKGILDTIREIRKQYYNEFPNTTNTDTKESLKTLPDSVDINWVALTNDELKKITSFAKKYKIHIPKVKEYPNIADFEFANSLFYKHMLRYLPISLEHIGITNIKTVEMTLDDFPYRLFDELKEDVATVRNIGKFIIISQIERIQMLERIALHGRNYLSPVVNKDLIPSTVDIKRTTIKQRPITKKQGKKLYKDVVYLSTTGSVGTKVNKTSRQYFLLKKLRKNYTIKIKGIILNKLSRDILSNYLIFKNILINTDSIELEKMIYNESIKKRSKETIIYYSLIIKRLLKLLNDEPDLVNKIITRTISRKELLRLLVPHRVAPVEKVIKTMKQLSLDPSIVRFEELTLNKSKTKDTIEAVLYNPYTGAYSREAYDGYLFQVYRLNKNALTGQPYTITVPYEDLNPRTGSTSFVMRTIEQDGPVPYIKFPIDMGNTIKTIWKEVNINDVKNYPLNYDTCERFVNENDCNSGRGLGNNQCVFKDNRCKVKLN